MKLWISFIALVLWPVCVYPLDVTLQWEPNTEPDLHHYTVYQAPSYGDRTGPWLSIAEIPKETPTYTFSVEEGTNFAWHVTASDQYDNESGASNTVQLYDKLPPKAPANLTKQLGGN